MSAEISDFVYCDGDYIEEESLLNRARNADTYQHAEHYLCPLLFHATIYKKDYLAEEVNKVRKHFSLPPFPSPHSNPASINNLPYYILKKKKPEDLAREKYKSFDKEKRIEIVRKCLIILTLKDKNIFHNKSCWIGIFLVIKDRLLVMSQTDFFEFAESCTPSDWDDKLRIGGTTMSNFGRYIIYEDREEAYYDMTNNPFEDLCEMFWSILRNKILTEN